MSFPRTHREVVAARKEWFLTHPRQRMMIPVLSEATKWSSPSDPLHVPTFSTVEIYWTGRDGDPTSRGQLIGHYGPRESRFDLLVSDHEAIWDHAVSRIISELTKTPMEPPSPPEPSGSGWDDFDWSI